MRYILKGRGLGKTTDLVYLSSQTGIPIVCSHPDHVLYEAKKNNLTIPEPIGYIRFSMMRQKPRKIYIDELAMFLNSILGCTVEAVTGTPEQ